MIRDNIIKKSNFNRLPISEQVDIFNNLLGERGIKEVCNLICISYSTIRDRFRRYRRKAGLNEKVTMHTLRHCYATNLIENGATLIQVKELMGHSNIRSTMEYVHVANIDLGLESPLDVFMRGEEDGKNTRNNK